MTSIDVPRYHQKTRMLLFIRRHYLLILCLVLALVLRLAFIDKIPTSIGGDELEYILNAKSFFVSGRDITGSITLFSPFFFQHPVGSFPQAELPYVVAFPFMVFSLSLLTAKLPFVIISVLTIFALYLFVKSILGEKIALIASFLAAINPWMIVLGRTAYDMGPSVLFYLLGMYVLITLKGRKIFWALPVLLLAFYSYIGTKIILFPLVLITAGYAYFAVHKKKYKKEYLVFVSIVFILMVVFGVIMNSSSSRLSEITLPTSPVLGEEVNALRKMTVQMPIISFFINKPVLFFDRMVDRFLGVFSFSYLFRNGDEFFSLYRQGLLYLFDLPFIVIGAVFLFLKKRGASIFLGLLILTATIPQLIHEGDGNFTPHITLLVPLLVIVSAVGIWYLYTLIAYKKIYIAGIALLYAILLANFLFVYFLYFPISSFQDLSVRILSRYINETPSNYSVVVITQGKADTFKKYLFYTDNLTKGNYEEVLNAFKAKEYNLGNVSFVSCGEEIKPRANLVQIVDVQCEARDATNSARISQLKDGGEVFGIKNDPVCSQYPLNSYPTNIKFSDFGVEKLSKERFCMAFISSR